jgi:hypothetical protein
VAEIDPASAAATGPISASAIDRTSDKVAIGPIGLAIDPAPVAEVVHPVAAVTGRIGPVIVPVAVVIDRVEVIDLVAAVTGRIGPKIGPAVEIDPAETGGLKITIDPVAVAIVPIGPATGLTGTAIDRESLIGRTSATT